VCGGGGYVLCILYMLQPFFSGSTIIRCLVAHDGWGVDEVGMVLECHLVQHW
jgi:hypothetical protein